jgi:hypothetical protein
MARPFDKLQSAEQGSVGTFASTLRNGSSQMLDMAKTKKLIGQCGSDEIVPTLVEYIKIPNKSPAFDPDWAAHGYMDEAVALFKKDPPYGARVTYQPGSSAVGWHAPARSPWLEQSLARASQTTFGAPPAYIGEGGTIPFKAMLGEKFPQAQFVVTGVLGPHSNAHGPNEFLHIPTGKRVSVVIAQVRADHHAQAGGQ